MSVSSFQIWRRLTTPALNSRSELGRQERNITPVDLAANEIYDILRKRLFKSLPDKAEIGDIAEAFGRKLEEAAKSKTAGRGAEAIADEISATYPFHLLPAFDGTRHEHSAKALLSAIFAAVERTQAKDVYRRLELANVMPDFDSWQPTKDEDSEPILLRTFVPGGERVFVPNAKLASNDPTRWQNLVIKKLHQKTYSVDGKRPLVWWLRWHASEERNSMHAIVKAFKKLIESDADPSLREEAVAAFANLTQPSMETQELLLRLLKNRNEHTDVRAASIRGLRETDLAQLPQLRRFDQ